MSVLKLQWKYTEMNLCHYAAEYGCKRFLKSIGTIVGESKMLALISKQARSGMNGFHFVA
jgi:hypothetical protein